MKDHKLIGRGRTAEIYHYEEEKVLKLFNKGFPEPIIDYEFKINRIVQEKFPFTPNIYDKIIVNGRIGLVYDFIPGPSLSDVFFQKPFRMFSLIKQLVNLQVKMHEIKVPELKSQLVYLKESIKNVDLLDESTKAQILNQIESLPDGDRLCHQDFHIENIIYSPKGLIVIDWMTARRGHPLGDVARTRYFIGFSAPIDKIPFFLRLPLKFARLIGRKYYESQYCQLTNYSKKEMKKWELVTLASRLDENIPEEKNFLLKKINLLVKKLEK
ncbi:MAG: phosphotransferase [Candidatus Heimdallarchaeota archaeon]|nr:phosphotransferase [Candidatus Heimdallarchaeota archaeon]